MPSPPLQTFDFVGASYRAPRLCAWSQWDALQILKPALAEVDRRANPPRRGWASRRMPLPAQSQDLLDTLTDLADRIPPDDLAALFDFALSNVERLDEGAWSPVWDRDRGVSLFDDLPAGRVTMLALHILWRNFTPYFQHRPVQFEPSKGINYEPVQLEGGLSWLMTPVERNMCRYESLLDGTLDLRDIARMNDQLAVTAENRHRAQKAAEDEAHLARSASR